jgi:signal transduction histidine kinase
VLQEALNNAVRHSGVRHFKVTLLGTPAEIQLEVIDAGRGFDPKAVIGHGLGLISMQERLSLVTGEIFIESRPGGGTTIRARVNLGHADDRAQSL